MARRRSRTFPHRLVITAMALLLFVMTPFEASAQRRRIGSEPEPAQGITTREYVEAIASMVFCVAWPDARYERLQWRGLQAGPNAPAPSGRRGNATGAQPSTVTVSAVLRGHGRADGAQRSLAVLLDIEGEVLRGVAWGEYGGGPQPAGGADVDDAVTEINAAYASRRPSGGELPPPFSSRCGEKAGVRDPQGISGG